MVGSPINTLNYSTNSAKSLKIETDFLNFMALFVKIGVRIIIRGSVINNTILGECFQLQILN